MRIDKVHQYIQFELDKASRGYVSPEQIDLVLDIQQMAEFTALAPRAGMYQQVHDDLAPFKKQVTYTAADYTGGTETGPDGIVVLPANYLHLLHVRTDTERIEILSDNEVGDRLDSVIITAPSVVRAGVGGTSNNIAFTSSYLQLYPKKGKALTVNYLSRPVVPKYSYTIVNRATVFDPLTSTDLQWNDEVTIRIIHRTLAALGVHLQAGDVTQLMEAKSQG
jgi:hypothetical protein